MLVGQGAMHRDALERLSHLELRARDTWSRTGTKEEIGKVFERGYCLLNGIIGTVGLNLIFIYPRDKGKDT
jgi:hypothetical protein